MNDYPVLTTPVNHVEPVPRRIRGFAGGQRIFETGGERLERPRTHFVAAEGDGE